MPCRPVGVEALVRLRPEHPVCLMTETVARPALLRLALAGIRECPAHRVPADIPACLAHRVLADILACPAHRAPVAILVCPAHRVLADILACQAAGVTLECLVSVAIRPCSTLPER